MKTKLPLIICASLVAAFCADFQIPLNADPHPELKRLTNLVNPPVILAGLDSTNTVPLEKRVRKVLADLYNTDPEVAEVFSNYRRKWGISINAGPWTGTETNGYDLRRMAEYPMIARFPGKDINESMGRTALRYVVVPPGVTNMNDIFEIVSTDSQDTNLVVRFKIKP